MKKSLILGMIMTAGISINAYAVEGTAIIQATQKDSNVSGVVSIVQREDGIDVEVQLANVPGEGKHGIHIHEHGDCSDEGKAAGGHFNPVNVKHGYLPQDGHDHAHAGDLGNILIAQDGTGTLKQFLSGVYLVNQEPSVAGLSIILHEKEDDFGQPVGNAGGRIGCGIIMLKDQGNTRVQAVSTAENL